MLQVGSRTVILLSGVFMILMGILGKIGAIFTTIPTPVLGGMFIIMFGIITAAGVSNLQVNKQQHEIWWYIDRLLPNTLLLFRTMRTRLFFKSTDMNSSRNIFIFGFSIFSALVIPNWIMKNPDFLETGTIYQRILLLFNSFHLN